MNTIPAKTLENLCRVREAVAKPEFWLLSDITRAAGIAFYNGPLRREPSAVEDTLAAVKKLLPAGAVEHVRVSIEGVTFACSPRDYALTRTAVWALIVRGVIGVDGEFPMTADTEVSGPTRGEDQNTEADASSGEFASDDDLLDDDTDHAARDFLRDLGFPRDTVETILEDRLNVADYLLEHGQTVFEVRSNRSNFGKVLHRLDALSETRLRAPLTLEDGNVAERVYVYSRARDEELFDRAWAEWQNGARS